MQRRGSIPGDYPRPLGMEAAGTIVGLGAPNSQDSGASAGFRVGDRVAFVMHPGAHAELVAVPATRMIRIPDDIDDDTAAGSALQGLTAHYLMTTVRPPLDGENVLVHAAAGGVGLLLTQLAVARGARVLATVSSPAKADAARQAGAAEIIPSDQPDIGEMARDLTDGVGVSAVYDGVGAATFAGSLAALAPRGTFVLYGQASGPPPPLAPEALGVKSITLVRPSLPHYISNPAELARRSGDLFADLASGRLQLSITGRYPLREAAAAHLALEDRRTIGKLLLHPAQVPA